ncbi:signal recognition particle receptor beta subunit-domain-containing protein [Naematelia encephala]|uniref:Signal recognition particle receptor subunit beta n=1 Tax=Naematelia encephala TaxID=71784 RepID=A0A1Y2AT17_9TREE|nr:signal recognition particle receptor beta subunit-domain-containing protein [Naematelia encephala]
MSTPEATPEVEPITSLIAHPLLQDPKFLAAVGGLVILLIFLSFFRQSSSLSTRRTGVPTVLLVGPSDAGKTALFAKLVHNVYPQTHTSLKTSITTFPLTSPDEPEAPARQIKLIDVPGHPRLKDEFGKYAAEAWGVVFVVDVVGLVRNAGSVAEQLPPILTTLSNLSLRTSQPLKLLILANKTDLLIRPTPPSSPSPPNIPSPTLSTAHERLKSILTREMDRLKAARGAGGVGGRIEGIGKVAGTGSGGFWTRLFGGSASSGSAAVEGEGDVEDEALIWGGKGAWRWEDVEGVEVEWAASGLGMVSVGKEKDKVEDDEEGDGLDELKRFIFTI